MAGVRFPPNALFKSEPIIIHFIGEVAKWSNASRSGRDPSGSGVRTPPSSSFVIGFGFLRYGVVGNMSGSHPVASGSIPGIEFFPLWKFWLS